MGHVAIDFLQAVFGDDTRGILITGQISGKSGPNNRGIDKPNYFIWPDQAEDIAKWHDENRNEDLYYSPMLYKVKQRTKEQVGYTPVIWCDADAARPESFELKPSFFCETSPGRFHCYWVLDQEVTPQWAEQMSKLVTYSNVEEGSDKSGWALAKYLRLPGAKNTKPEYFDPLNTKRWKVSVEYLGTIYSPDELTGVYGSPDLNLLTSTSDTIPDPLPNKADVMSKITANPKLVNLLTRAPATESWSEPLWLLECSLFRLGLTAPEVFVLVNGCACDKYARDRRPPLDLWKDVQRADRAVAEKGEVIFEMMSDDPDNNNDPLPPPPGIELLTDAERVQVPRSFIDEYCEWAGQKTNADMHYHEFSAMTLMSLVLGEFGHCEMSYGITKLNLWFMVLGVTTRTYKTTAKNLMLNILRGIQNDKYNYDLGSDATPEGLLLELADRPKRSSFFHRDEAQGMLHSAKGGKNYMSGFVEALTELYDGYVPGRLRATGTKKIEPTETQFCLYLAGVPDKIGQVLTDSDFESGFLARFLFTIGTPEPLTEDSLTLKQIVRAVDRDTEVKSRRDMTKLQTQLVEARKYWSDQTQPGETVDIWLSDEAIDRLNQANIALSRAALSSDNPKLIEPTANRMHKSILKLACLLAMMRHCDEVSLGDMLTAIQYCETWFNTMIHMTALVRQTEFSNRIHEFVDYIRRNGVTDGMAKYMRVRRRYDHLSVRDWNDLISAATDMNYIEVVRDSGRGKPVYIRPL